MLTFLTIQIHEEMYVFKFLLESFASSEDIQDKFEFNAKNSSQIKSVEKMNSQQIWELAPTSTNEEKAFNIENINAKKYTLLFPKAHLTQEIIFWLKMFIKITFSIHLSEDLSNEVSLIGCFLLFNFRGGSAPAGGSLKMFAITEK